MHRSPRPCPAGSESSRPGRWQPEDVRSQQGFQSLNLSRGTCYRAKFICIERGSTYEPSVDIRHAEQGLGIIRLDTAAIDNLYLLSLLVIQQRQACANHRMHFLRLLRTGGQTRTYRPDRLVGNHTLGQATDTEAVQHHLQLPPDHIRRLVGIPLLAGLADTEYRSQPGEIGRASCRERVEIAGGAGGVTKK